MRRRDLSVLLGATALMPAAAVAQSTPVEGRHYVRLNEPVPVGAPAGKIEVVDFFWYGCPHCAAFEPELDFWAGHLPDHVAFVRVPVAFRAEPFTTHQKIFYALESLGQLGEMHRRIFYAIHVEKLALDKPTDIAAYMSQHGVDATRFMEAFSSFTTQSKIKRANLLVDGYKIDGVPAIGVHGRYYTSGAMAGGNDRALLVADFLLQKLHKGA
jgi:protein dithiol oxidoreductase (disulfide-forming)